LRHFSADFLNSIRRHIFKKAAGGDGAARLLFESVEIRRLPAPPRGGSSLPPRAANGARGGLMAMATDTGGGRRAMTDINVTPLVDVMLVLLIIFMVTAPLIQSGVKVDLPRASAQQMEHSEEKLVLTIDRQRRIFLGDTQISPADLE